MLELPAWLILGPRATGKATTSSGCAATTVRLDPPGEGPFAPTRTRSSAGSKSPFSSP